MGADREGPSSQREGAYRTASQTRNAVPAANVYHAKRWNEPARSTRMKSASAPMPETQATAPPTAIARQSSGEGGSAFKAWRSAAPTIAGIAIMNENSAAAKGATPIASIV